jgi:dTDP-4-amino-4,6-dideoxygalactose transaminase
VGDTKIDQTIEKNILIIPFDESIKKRKELSKLYNNLLANVRGITLMKIKSTLDYNYAYYPILINENEFGCSRDKLYEQLKKCKIFTRRYFYPLISDFPTYRVLPSSATSNLKTAAVVSGQILCLPIYPDLGSDNVEYIVRCLLKSGKR